MSEDDHIYFQQRAEVESRRAAEAKQPEVVSAHSQLAAAYRQRAKSIGQKKSADG